MRPTVLLFDVDGTLLTTVGAGRRALERSFMALHGTAAALSDIRLNGMTDRAIVRQALAAMGRPSTGDVAERAIDAVLAHYLETLADEVAAASGLALHPGVPALLDALAAMPHVALGLGTGNVREGARLKLGRVGAFDRFRFGGFGCDHEERAELLRIGARRGADLLGTSPAGCRVVVIGDTPLDVAAGRAIGADVVGVGTSGVDPGELIRHGARAAFADLTDLHVLDVLAG